MTSLAQKLSDIVGAAFEAEGLPRSLGAVRVSDRPDLAQFQCNGAMAAAKVAGAKPRDVAEKIVARLKKDPSFVHLEIAGPGFVNIKIADSIISNHLAEIGQSEMQGIEPVKGENVMLDYGGPNIAKPMHVGHLRASIIGDSLRRMYKFAGYTTTGDVHFGDWGTQMGQVISELEIRGELDKPLTIEHLEEIYPAASQACKADEARAEVARAATVRLQKGDPTYRKIWQEIVDVSIASMKKNFEALNVHFDLWKGEASVNDLIAPMVETLKKKTYAQESDGALIIHVHESSDKKEMPPLMLYKRDGAVMYGTTDLATVVDRVREYKPAKIVYVVDQRQHLHFEQVFRAAKRLVLAGIIDEVPEMIHAGFGTMNGTDGKPFKTREGGVMKLEDMIAMGVEKARARLKEAELAQDADAAEVEHVAHMVAIAAIKFADLQNNRIADYVFDIDRMTSFEGKTGPYLLYQTVRIKSLLKKAGAFKAGAFVIKDEDRALALLLSELPDHFEAALKNYTPHVLAEHIFKLAQAFSTFYASCHILSETDEALRSSRLALCDLTRKQLELGLGLLGIRVPERM